MSLQSDTPKDTALQAVGRTVVNFQRLEHNLKLAAQLGPVQGTVHKIQRDVEKRKEQSQSLTLGQAIQAWLNYIDGGSAPPTWTPDMFDFSFRMTFSLESDLGSPDAHAKTLSSLLEIRNSLIHTRLATFPWDSADECSKLVIELDSVNTIVGQQLDYVARLLKEIERVHKEAAEASVAAIEAAYAHQTAGKAMPNPSEQP